MIRALIIFILCLAVGAQAHVGSPDVFYDGMAGPYPTRVTIRMPGVVPGRAEISVRVQASEPVDVSFLPLYSWTDAKNAPPPDVGRLISGETNLYVGELWLMSFGAYSVEVRIKGAKGDGVAQIPVNSQAIRQLPMPLLLGMVLVLLAAVLVVGGIGIASAAGREATLLPDAMPGEPERRNGVFAAAGATIVFVLALGGGNRWWKLDEEKFRENLREGAWPDMAADVRVKGGERILRLEVGEKIFQAKYQPALIPDHGKLMHVFLVREGSHDGFAHLHPIRKERYIFEAVVPPLPEGRYAIFCDLTFEGGGSSTATTSILLPSIPVADESAASVLERDPDDSWAIQGGDVVPAAASIAPVYHLPSGEQVVWKSQKPLRVKEDASLRFAVMDSAGESVALKPYMGMAGHAAVLRRDGAVFAHLHPVGNFSMAAQSFFEAKLAREVGDGGQGIVPVRSDQDHSIHRGQSGGAESSVYFPYEFPAPGEYRIWVQFKTGERILTAAFDAQVDS